MLEHLVRLWCYWEWYFLKNGPRDGRNATRRSFALGAILILFPTMGICCLIGIFYRTQIIYISEKMLEYMFIVTAGALIAMGIFAGRKINIKIDEFKAMNKATIKKYDAFVWVFALSCVFLFILMGVVGAICPAPHANSIQ